MKYKNNYNIMTSCNDTLVPYVAISITAMAKNLKHDRIDFWLLYSRINVQNLEMLKAVADTFDNIVLHEVYVSDSEKYNQLAQYGGGWAGEAYYALNAHLLLPETIERAMYIDAGDVLIVGDIAPYYFADFQDNSLIVTPGRYKQRGDDVVCFEADDLGDWKNELPKILRGIFNSGSYVMNLDKMRKDGRRLEDYQFLAAELCKIIGDEKHVYWGDQGLLSAAFVGDVKYFMYPQIRNLWYMPYNFCVWYYDAVKELPPYEPAVVHFAGCAFKPWKGKYPIFLERFQDEKELRSLNELKAGQIGYFYMWHEYALLTEEILRKVMN